MNVRLVTKLLNVICSVYWWFIWRWLLYGLMVTSITKGGTFNCKKNYDCRKILTWPFIGKLLRSTFWWYHFYIKPFQGEIDFLDFSKNNAVLKVSILELCSKHFWGYYYPIFTFFEKSNNIKCQPDAKVNFTCWGERFTLFGYKKGLPVGVITFCVLCDHATLRQPGTSCTRKCITFPNF
jgi:hypothetical protein